MQSVLTYFTLLVSVFMMEAQNNVEVSMYNFDNDKGKAMVGLFNEKGDFLDAAYVSLSSEIKDKTASVIFTDVPDGTYAISCYHDKDDNGVLNMFMGMWPTESYGCSNNARGSFGPPTWEDAKFDLTDGENRKIDIKL